MKNETKRTYLTPQLTVVQFRTERGYASSGPNILDRLTLFDTESTPSDQMEQYDTRSNWHQGGQFWD